MEELGILSFDDFYDKQASLHDSLVLELLRRIEAYDLGVHLLLGGVDEKAHLYRIAEPGTYRSFDELGFCCIGSGDRHADPVFAFYGFSPKLSVVQALRIGFEAKKRAEMAGGVGKQTDAWVIEQGGTYEVKAETIEQLEKAHVDQEDLSRFLASTEESIDVKTAKLECPPA